METYSSATAVDTYTSKDGTTVNDDTLPTLLHTLQMLGCGVSRTTYALSDTEVLKYATDMYSHAGNNRSEHAAWENIEGSEYESCFARVYAISADGRWMVSERLEGTAGDLGHRHGDTDTLEEMWNAASWFDISDLHDGNWGWREDGSAAILDYAMNEHRSMEGCDSERCYCGDHQCDDCFPNGCTCEEFDGCRETACSRCFLHPAHKFASRSWFGFVPRCGTRVCMVCAPLPVKRDQIMGQLGAFAMLGSHACMDTVGRVVRVPAQWTMVKHVPR